MLFGLVVLSATAHADSQSEGEADSKPPSKSVTDQPAPSKPEAAPPASPKPEGSSESAPAGGDEVKGGEGAATDKGKEATKKVTFPKPLNYVEPVYPEQAKKDGIEAEVLLKLDISVKGEVTRVEVFRAAGQGFDEAATAAAKGLRFSPALKADGTPFAARIVYRYKFEIEEVEVVKPEVTKFGQLEGRVEIADLDVPLVGATVKIKKPDGSELVRRSDAKGQFKLEELEPGAYQVEVTADGHLPISSKIEVTSGEVASLTLRLNPDVKGGVIDVVVEGVRPPREVTRRTIERREIERIPGTSGDALRAIQSLPGVARPPGLAGLLLVRGSSPQDTQTFVDGVGVPLIYHFGGLSSVIPTEVLSKIDFYPGNFSARYGRRQGGIVDAGIRDPKSDGYHGMAQLDLIDARFVFEGPIPGTEEWSFLVAGRRSWVDAWLGPVLEEAGAGVTSAPVYYDYQVVVQQRSKSRKEDGFRMSFYGSDDLLEILNNDPIPNEPALSGSLGLHTGFQRLQLGYQKTMSSKGRFVGDLSIGHDEIEFGLGSLFFNLELYQLFGRYEYQHQFLPWLKGNFGIDMFRGVAKVAARLPARPPPGQPPNQPFSTRNLSEVDQLTSYYQPAAYAEFELTPHPRLRLVPGVRLDYARVTKGWDVNPRLNARVVVRDRFPKTTIKGGVGLYSQPPQFQEAVPPFGTEGLLSNRAVHYGLGVEQDITKQIELSVEGFYKQLDNQVVANADRASSLSTYTNDASGYVAGAEVLLKYKPDKRFFGWLAYTLSRSVRRNGPDLEEYLVPFDQPHILTVLGSYKIGKGWEAGARFRLVSGGLQTPNVCDTENDSCDATRINALYHGASGVYTPIPFGAVSSERMPLFHALDVRVDKTWEFKAWKLSFYVDIQNVYNHENVEGLRYNFNFTDREYTTGLPILPSLGLRGEF